MSRPDPAPLLAGLAAALSACDGAGLKVKLKHGIVITRHGYVLPVAQGWIARTLAYTEFSDGEDED